MKDNTRLLFQRIVSDQHALARILSVQDLAGQAEEAVLLGREFGLPVNQTQARAFLDGLPQRELSDQELSAVAGGKNMSYFSDEVWGGHGHR